MSRRRTKVTVQPGEQTVDASCSQSNAAIGRAIIKPNGIPVCVDGLPTRKDNVIDVSAALIGGLWAEYPRYATLQTYLWFFKIEESQA